MQLEGLLVKEIKNINKYNGNVIPIIKNNDFINFKFGEAYFSTIHPNVIKAWHLHKKISVVYSVIFGSVLSVFYDARKHSKTNGQIKLIYTNTENRFLIKVPKNIWVGFKCLGKKTAIISNITSGIYSSDPPRRLEAYSKLINFNWDKEILNK